MTAREGLLRRVLLVNLVAQSVIVVTGGLVRLTGSGLGCPTWPECVPGSYTPAASRPRASTSYIEFGNRLLTFVRRRLAAIAALVAVWRWGTARAPAAGRWPRSRWSASRAGAARRHHRADRACNPATVAAHFLLSMVLIAASTCCCWLATGTARRRRRDTRPMRGPPRGPRAGLGRGRHRRRRRSSWAPSSPAPDRTRATPTEPARFGFDPQTVSWLHADAVLLFLRPGRGAWCWRCA